MKYSWSKCNSNDNDNDYDYDKGKGKGNNDQVIIMEVDYIGTVMDTSLTYTITITKTR